MIHNPVSRIIIFALYPDHLWDCVKLMIHSPGVTGWEVYIANAPKVLPSPPFSRSKNPLDTVVARPFAVSDDEWEVGRWAGRVVAGTRCQSGKSTERIEAHFETRWCRIHHGGLQSELLRFPQPS